MRILSMVPMIKETDAIRAEHLVRTIQEISRQVRASDDYEAKRADNRKSFQETFCMKRVDKEVQMFVAKMNTKRRTTVEPESGVDVTGKSRGMLRLSDLRKDVHFDALHVECTEQGISLEQGLNFTQTRLALKEHLTKTKEKALTADGYFHPKSDELKLFLDM